MGLENSRRHRRPGRTLHFVLVPVRHAAQSRSERREVLIDRPAAQVWRYITVDSLTLKWVGGLKEIHHVRGPVGAVGEVLQMSEGVEGQKFEMEMEITAFEPNRHFGFTLRSLGDPNYGFHEVGEYQLEENGGRTRLRLSGTSEYFGFIFKLLEPMITPSAQKKLVQDLARLKSLVEAEPPVAPPASAVSH